MTSTKLGTRADDIYFEIPQKKHLCIFGVVLHVRIAGTLNKVLLI